MAFKKINDVSCKDSTIATLVDLSDAGPVSLHKFKTSGSDRSKYFSSLEMARKIKSQMTLKTAIPGATSHLSCLMNFLTLTSTLVNPLMIDATDMDEKFTMMKQTIEALKKSIDDKNLQITQLMRKLDLYNFGESHHILTIQEKFDIDSPTKPINSQSAKRSASVATLTVQQL
ncbi:hypothetical protein KY290_021779 [Solanum tuberosum]|uniref:Polyprotein protein n=1 Tax=Solanum tuberosum TaxID=4113 RepID=A0ABQ7V4I9_SOLTU|nr:hypothetical protein KY289_020943 [Solanum tuberosum]KAH0758286.1 hypothetical protein KY290_021779 [Solanum tuberosum]